MNKKVHTDFLFAQPSYASGAARMLDLWGRFDDYNRSESAAKADARAIASDWAMIGQDIFCALEQYEAESKLA